MPAMAEQVEKGLRDPNPPSDSIYTKFPINVKQKVSVVAGSYTDSTQLKQLANADVFFFKWIFNDNKDTSCSKILAGLYQIMKPTAKIIICEVVYNYNRNEWKFTTTLDLIMCLLFNSKERSTNDWIQLLSKGEGYQFNVSFADCTISKQIWEMKLITLTKIM